MTNLETRKSETMNNIINTSEIEVGDTFSTYTKLVSALGKDSDKLQSAVSEYYARLEEIKK